MTDAPISAPIHAARTMSFDDLLRGLEAARAARAVYRRFDLSTGLSLWIYSDACVYDDLWDDVIVLARGLVLHESTRSVVATPFPKFFNAGEKHGTIPDGPFEAYEKLDGSLIVLFHWDGAWRTVTKGAFDSAQALWARAWIARFDLSLLDPGATYLLEATYPENRIVVLYDRPALVFLAAYDAGGAELDYAALTALAGSLGWPVATRHPFASVADMAARAATLPASEEGFVARWADGTRLKVKGAEYRRVHSLISRVTPIALWEMLVAGDDLDAVRRQVPEEYWADFDAIRGLLAAAISDLRGRLEALAGETAALSDKEVGLALQGSPRRRAGLPLPVPEEGLGGRPREGREVRPADGQRAARLHPLPRHEPRHGRDGVALAGVGEQRDVAVVLPRHDGLPPARVPGLLVGEPGAAAVTNHGSECPLSSGAVEIRSGGDGRTADRLLYDASWPRAAPPLQGDSMR